MDAVLVRCVRDLGPINAMGTNKMLRNVLALQQNLRNLGESPIEVDFRSRRYWSLAGSGDVKVRAKMRWARLIDAGHAGGVQVGQGRLVV